MLAILVGVLAVGNGARAADVSLYSVVKERQYLQTGTTPALAAGNAHRFSAAVIVSPGGVVTSASVQRGVGGTTFALTNSTPPGVFLFAQGFASQAALDAAFPNATSYIIAMNAGTDGPRTPQLTFGPDAYPNAPRVLSLTTLQQADSQAPITLQWEPFTGGLTNDVIQLLVEDGQSNVVFNSPVIGSPGALNGTATGVIIPAGVLAPASAYTVTLAFARLQVNAFNLLFAYPNVPGVSAFAARTRFTLQTAPRTATRQPRLRVLVATPGAVTVAFDAEIGAAYRLQGATNPVATTWTTLLTTNAASTNVIYVDGGVGMNAGRYYRVVSP